MQVLSENQLLVLIYRCPLLKLMVVWSMDTMFKRFGGVFLNLHAKNAHAKSIMKYDIK